jgi:hypothetical protein
LGPVEAVERNSDTGTTQITVLGQTFVSDLEEVGAAVGDYVLAASRENGELAVLVSAGESYVPGSSAVWVIGTVDGVTAPIAQFSVGEATFDYSSLLSLDPSLSLEAGDIVDFYGIQPVPGGSVILGIHGSDSQLRGIHGSDSRVRGIHGSDNRVRGIHGSDRR